MDSSAWFKGPAAISGGFRRALPFYFDSRLLFDRIDLGRNCRKLLFQRGNLCAQGFDFRRRVLRMRWSRRQSG